MFCGKQIQSTQPIHDCYYTHQNRPLGFAVFLAAFAACLVGVQKFFTDAADPLIGTTALFIGVLLVFVGLSCFNVTGITPDGIAACSVFGKRMIPWAAVKECLIVYIDESRCTTQGVIFALEIFPERPLWKYTGIGTDRYNDLIHRRVYTFYFVPEQGNAVSPEAMISKEEFLAFADKYDLTVKDYTVPGAFEWEDRKKLKEHAVSIQKK